MRNQRGFTLLELLVTMALIVIISGLSMPYIHAIIVNQRRQSVKTELLATLSYARMMAINHREFVTICPSIDEKACITDWQQPLIVFIDSEKKAMRHEAANVLRHSNRLAYGQLHFAAFPSKRYLRFHPTGFTDNQNGTFTYCYQHQGWQVIVNRAARARVKKMPKC